MQLSALVWSTRCKQMRTHGGYRFRSSYDWVEAIAKEISAIAGSEEEALALCAVAAVARGGGWEIIEELAEEINGLGRRTRVTRQ